MTKTLTKICYFLKRILICKFRGHKWETYDGGEIYLSSSEILSIQVDFCERCDYYEI